MVWKPVVSVAVLLAVAFAGCSDSGAAPDVAESNDIQFEVEKPAAKSGLGYIVGVVVDETITPVVGATVELVGTELTTTTDENGAFVFNDLEPATYFVSVSKLGYFETQVSTDVAADVEAPILKVLMELDAESLPYVQELAFVGFLECSTTYVALCAVPNTATGLAGQPPVTNDKFIVYHDLDSDTPQWIQSEMIWENTQALSDRLWLWHSHGVDGAFTGSFAHTTGKSPLKMVTTEEEAAANNPGENWQLVARVFSGDIEGTTPPTCVLFCNGPGIALQQEFEIFTHVFYNYVPGEDWRFSESPVPTP